MNTCDKLTDNALSDEVLISIKTVCKVIALGDYTNRAAVVYNPVNVCRCSVSDWASWEVLVKHRHNREGFALTCEPQYFLFLSMSQRYESFREVLILLEVYSKNIRILYYLCFEH